MATKVRVVYPDGEFEVFHQADSFLLADTEHGVCILRAEGEEGQVAVVRGIRSITRITVPESGTT